MFNYILTSYLFLSLHTVYANSVESMAAKATNSKYYIDVKFEKGSTQLDDKAMKAVNAILGEAKKNGKIDEVIVLSWSDTEYPGDSIRTLSKDERKLADKRNRAVAKYTKSIDYLRSLDVETYNMAEKSNSLTRWTKEHDYEIKKSLQSAENQLPSKASHSVILVKLKDQI